MDILADASLDYPDELLKELDCTVCSIHSRFGLGKTAQTERILRAMDNRCSRSWPSHWAAAPEAPRLEIGIERIIAHAKQNGCFFEINSSPDRLDLSADNARLAANAGIKIAVSTDAHSTREFDLIRYGLDQARWAGLDKSSGLNCLSWNQFSRKVRNLKLS